MFLQERAAPLSPLSLKGCMGHIAPEQTLCRGILHFKLGVGCHDFSSHKFQSEGLKSQNHCLLSLQNALWTFRSPRGHVCPDRTFENWLSAQVGATLHYCLSSCQIVLHYSVTYDVMLYYINLYHSLAQDKGGSSKGGFPNNRLLSYSICGYIYIYIYIMKSMVCV